MSKTKLFLLTACFPYPGVERVFITPELPYLTETFDVTVITRANNHDVESDHGESSLYRNIDVVRYVENKKRRLYSAFKMILDRDMWKEIGYICQSKTNIFGKIKNAIRFYIYSVDYEKFLKKVIPNGEKVIIYSYWYSDICYGAVRYKRKNRNVKLVTRTHGNDLCNEQAQYGRQVFKAIMDPEIDKIMFACEYARSYYLKEFATDASMQKYVLCRLGTAKDICKEKRIVQNNHIIVSCSRVIPLKRVELIVEGLSLIDDLPIQWIHFGDGEELENTKELAKKLLGKKNNISYLFNGQTNNKEIREFYKNNQVDVFITTTSTEGGCPVSIQEAMLFEIPIIGTSVGGVTEMISGNGILLEETPSKQQVRNAIIEILSLEEDKRRLMRQNSKLRWLEMFDIEKNAPRVIRELRLLI